MSKAPINWTNMLLFSLTPLFAVILVPLYGFYYGYDGFEWTVFAVFMVFCGLSITAGYHRLWSHKAYKAHPAVRFLFALGGACALQNDVLTWASDHRRHHRFVDDNDHDPYSAGRGFWFSHIGWILRHYQSGRKDLSNVKDLQKDPILRWQRKHYLLLVLIMNIGLPALIGWIHGDILASLLLAGLLRLVLSQHVTYLINSLAHMWGRQPYSTGNSARDNSLLALITYGEGYHNYHHAFQWDYRNGIRWWHWDPTKWLIRSLSFVGLTQDLRRCNPATVEAARLQLQFQRATEKCALLDLPDKWRQSLEREYQELTETLKLWNRHRLSWYEAKSRDLQESFNQLDMLHI
ncbi:MAG: fatty acid desaturase, partial [Gammaproteobacteria bacterium]|nr:fatty acid desaturase [Gammaproteobacteria bacterium]